MSHLLTKLAQRLLSVISLLICLTLINSLMLPLPTWAAASGLGINNGYLAPCPTSPNCVVSQNGDDKHAIAPLEYHVDRDTARGTLLKVLSVVPRTEVVEQTNDYIHALSQSRIFKFVDDVEFYLPADEKVIHVRSASRVGDWDLGVNHRRIEQIRLALKDLKI